MTVIAGPNGSGKTTLLRALVSQGLDAGVHINADDIALTLDASAERDRRAQGLAQEVRDDCIASGTTFTFETVMSHPSKVEEMGLAVRKGFKVRLIYVGLEDPIINRERVGLRVKQGGHDVPADRIAARYERSMRLLPLAILTAHEALVFDNSDADRGHRLVAVCTRTTIGGKRSLVVEMRGDARWFRAIVEAPEYGLRVQCRKKRLGFEESAE
ncbi:MAG TPA: zeta toxin family protein [Beijerinckiaceae bacterium]|nr:zeta toxin family protein [Beijerinckiaceae bacterium]